MEMTQDTVKKSNMEKVFSLFVGSDRFRPEMHSPFEINGKVYATDAIALIRTNKENVDFELSNPHNPPKCESVIPGENTSLILNITKEMVEQFKTDDEYEYIGENVECDACCGFGEVEWEFENHTKNGECPVCDGDGLSSKKKRVKTGGKTFGKCAIVIKDAYFHINVFNKLIEARDILGGEILLVNYSGNNKAALFKVCECEILLSPVVDTRASYWDSVLKIA